MAPPSSSRTVASRSSFARPTARPRCDWRKDSPSTARNSRRTASGSWPRHPRSSTGSSSCRPARARSAGSSRRPTAPDRWFPDGRKLLLELHRTKAPPSLAVYDVAAGTTRPLPWPAGFQANDADFAVSPTAAASPPSTRPARPGCSPRMAVRCGKRPENSGTADRMVGQRQTPLSLSHRRRSGTGHAPRPRLGKCGALEGVEA